MTGTQLKSWRERAELTQAGLADLLGISANTIARWERDEVGIPPYLQMTLDCIKQKKQAKK